MNKKVLEHMLSKPQKCVRSGEGTCEGRLTIEHAFGRKYEAFWNTLWLCWFHHIGAGLNKELNRHLAYQQATDEDLRKLKSYQQMVTEKKYLEKKYAKSFNNDV